MATNRAQIAAASGIIGISILAAGDAANFYSGALPSFFTISSDFFQKGGSQKGNVKRIRQGEILATGLSLSVGLGASLVAGNWLPLVATSVVCAVLIAGYEFALRHPASQEG